MKKTKPWILDAIDYWSQRIYEGDTGIDWGDDTAKNHCWRCGCKRSLQKCHIVPKSLGGSDDVSNLIPLCAMCHDEAPNVNDPNAMWQWIKDCHGEVYNTFWIEKAFDEVKVNKKQFKLIQNKSKKFIEIVKNVYKNTSTHFGQHAGGSRTTVSTWTWVFKQAIKELSNVN